tara:strand:+ start:971 stop:2119 length:1149 start_codon:yes stop_codon:yes gene_type:complete
MEEHSCHICNSNDITIWNNPDGISGVTSDCKVWPELSTLGLCNTCGYPQTITSEKWYKSINKIYGNYEIYRQGVNQDHYLIHQGKNTSRSKTLISKIKENKFIAENAGSMIEIGPGNGNMLKVFRTYYESWDLNASDVNDNSMDTILALDGVKQFYSCPIERIERKFDFILSVHSLEHIPSPFEFLVSCKKILYSNGKLVINVPNCTVNPFIISVVDHCSHFTPFTLVNLIQAAGFDVEIQSTNWIAKEIVVIAKNNPNKLSDKSKIALDFPCEDIHSHFKWLKSLIDHLRNWDRSKKLGCLGTSIAGTWVYAHMKADLKFFVDEDRGRQGNQHLGLPIYSMDQVDADSQLILAFPYKFAVMIAERLESYPFSVMLPPKCNP